MTHQAYTRYIKILRLVLPSLAGVGLVALLVWPWWREFQMTRTEDAEKIAAPIATPETPSAPAAPLQVMKPDYQGLDSKGRPYRITATRVEQALDPAAPLKLIEPHATLDLEPQHEDEEKEATSLSAPTSDAVDDSAAARKLTLAAVQGIYSPKEQTLDLKGNVVLTTSEGYEIKTQDLAVDIVKGAALTTTPVEGHGPRGFLSGQALSIADKGALVVLKGPSRLILTPEPAPSP